MVARTVGYVARNLTSWFTQVVQSPGKVRLYLSTDWSVGLLRTVGVKQPESRPLLYLDGAKITGGDNTTGCHSAVLCVCVRRLIAGDNGDEYKLLFQQEVVRSNL